MDSIYIKKSFDKIIDSNKFVSLKYNFTAETLLNDTIFFV